MRKILFLFVALALFLVACGDDSEEANTSSNNDTSNNTQENSTDDEQNNNEDTDNNENAEEEVDESGDDEQNTNIIETDSGEFTLINQKEDLGTHETGPMVVTLNKINSVSGTLNEETAALMETEAIEYIQVDMEVENTESNPITFFAGQATLITDTGEQLESDMWLSEHIDGEFLDAVTKTGSNVYVLENSKAEDVKSIKLMFSAPIDENWDDVGEDLTIEIDLQ